MDKNSKTLVVYFSAQNHTKNVATKIAESLNADVFEIEPAQLYTESDLSWTDSDSRVSREHNDENLQKATGDNWQLGHRFSQDATDVDINEWIEKFVEA